MDSRATLSLRWHRALRITERSEEDLQAGRDQEPPWLTAALELYRTEVPGHGRSFEIPARIARDPEAGFLHLLEPVLRSARDRLRVGLERIARGVSGPRMATEAIEERLIASLAGRLLWMISRTMVLELNAARVMETLEGKDPEERFRSFVSRLRDPAGNLELLESYPVLARCCIERTQAWLEASLEFLERLERDWDAIRTTLFADTDPGDVVDLDVGAGDSHGGGRSVCIVELSSGARVVYKPRSLAVDLHFQELLGWINACGVPWPYRTLRVLDRQSHGWTEFVTATTCSNEEEVRAYHMRLGGLLAALHVVGAVDMHFENLIAAGDQPVPVDLETLFHATPPRTVNDVAEVDRVPDALEDTVLRTGLLPFRLDAEVDDEEAPDISGMASVENQRAPDSVIRWEARARDDMHAGYEHPLLPGGRNQPKLDGKAVEVASYIDDVAAGFERVDRLFEEHRAELLASDGPILRFANDPVRVVLRPSRVYGALLDESWHPDFLGDALDRDRSFDWLETDTRGIDMAGAIPFEQEDLWHGDIPCFLSRPASRDLLSWDGRVVQADFFAESALDATRRRVRALGEADLERQSWLTRVAIGTSLLNRNQGEWLTYTLERSPAALPTKPNERAMAEARKLGEWFERMAVHEHGVSSWVTLDFRNERWSLAGASSELYSGNTGIVLFLAYLAEVTGDDRFAALARSGLEAVRRRLRSDPAALVGPGLMQGWGGAIYTLAHLASLWRTDEILREIDQHVGELVKSLAQDGDFDIVGGAAGGIAGLLALERVRPGPDLRAATRACGDHLLLASRPFGGGIGWPNRLGGDRPVTGFSHGSAGIASALIDLAERLVEPRFRAAAEQALSLEDELVERRLEDHGIRAAGVPAAERGVSETITMSWCHGLPGLCLARLRAIRDSEDDDAWSRLETLMDLIAESGFGRNHCLCHGDLGNLDVLAQFAALRPDSRAARELPIWIEAVIASIEREGWRCGTWEGVQVPGLMNGMAGIGLGLLRIACPEEVPSVLAYHAPPAASGRPS